MDVLVVLVFLLIAVEAEDEGKIVGGSEVSINQFPYQVGLLIDNQLFCGGSIIADQWVLTAAHCVVRIPRRSVRIRAGSSDYASGGELVTAAKFISHPRYNSRTSDYDVAVIRVSPGFKSGQAIALANSELPAGQPVWVTGWGALQTGAGGTRKLRAVQLRTLDRSTCNTDYRRLRLVITGRMICATSPGKDSCQGDSGGPLVGVAGGKQQGIVSWGQECASSDYPGVYTNVASVRSFIRDNARV